MTDTYTFKRLAGSLREYKAATIVTPLFVIGEAVVEVCIPFFTAKLINTIQAGASLQEILPRCLVLFAFALASFVFGSIAGLTCSKASCGLAKNLRHDMFFAIQDFSFGNIDHFSNASLVTRLTTDVNNVQQAFMMIIRLAIRAPIILVLSLTMAWFTGGRMAIIFAITIPILIICLGLIIHNARPIFQRVFYKYDKLNESVEENINAARVVKSYVRQKHEKQKFQVAAEDIQKDFTRAERIMALNGPLMNLCQNATIVFVCYFGSKLIVTSHGTLFDLGQFSAIITYSFAILMSLMQLSMIFTMVTMAEESAHRCVSVLDTKSDITSPQNAITQVTDGSIDFKNVSFKYRADAMRYALQDVNLHINSGETIGIVGGTGSSKTSLIQLISRLYDATQGEVCIGAHNVKEYDLKVLRDNVAVVLQKNMLFAGTIKDNLRWGNENATDDEIVEAAKLACADEFIERFPNTYDTWIEQGGANVSGGQKQRLCIARALLKKPKILILDDSTSAVDTKTDALIRQGFKEYIPQTTKIIIAQRISSVQDADRICVMNDGHIDQVGTHDELLATNEIYKEMYLSQQKHDGKEDK